MKFDIEQRAASRLMIVAPWYDSSSGHGHVPLLADQPRISVQQHLLRSWRSLALADVLFSLRPRAS